MALARITCGACGTSLTLHDTVCPQCKSPVEFPPTPGSGQSVCPSCGQQNTTRADVCASCGARIGAAKPHQSVKPLKPQKSVTSPTAVARRRDPWPYVALAAIVVLVAAVVYTQWGGVTKSGPPATQQSPQLPATPPVQTVTAQQVESLRQEVAANPADMGLVVKLANGQQDLGQFAAAIDSYKKYLKNFPNDADARVDMGICYYQLGLGDSSNATKDFVTAIQAMRQANKISPTHQPAAFNLGIVYLQMGEIDSSNMWFRGTVQMNKDSDLGTRAQRILQQHTFAR